MLGRVNVCDLAHLAVGGGCLIHDLYKSGPADPVVVWWGRILGFSAGERGVDAMIDGGPFKCNPTTGSADRTHERMGDRLQTDHHVYPDTETTRLLFHRLIKAHELVASLQTALPKDADPPTVGTSFARMT